MNIESRLEYLIFATSCDDCDCEGFITKLVKYSDGTFGMFTTNNCVYEEMPISEKTFKSIIEDFIAFQGYEPEIFDENGDELYE